MSSLWYDRTGEEISVHEANELLGNFKYKVVKQDTVWYGLFFISTVWLGLDHSFSFRKHKPIIFETMVFCRFNLPRFGQMWKRWRFRDFDKFMQVKKFPYCSDLDMLRYTSEKDALRGHKGMLMEWSYPEKIFPHIWKHLFG